MFPSGWFCLLWKCLLPSLLSSNLLLWTRPVKNFWFTFFYKPILWLQACGTETNLCSVGMNPGPLMLRKHSTSWIISMTLAYFSSRTSISSPVNNSHSFCKSIRVTSSNLPALCLGNCFECCHCCYFKLVFFSQANSPGLWGSYIVIVICSQIKSSYHPSWRTFFVFRVERIHLLYDVLG